MADAAHSATDPAKADRGFDRAFAIVVLGIAAILAFQMLSFRTGIADALTTDDIMRLVEVRNLIDGQGWFDLHEYRLDPPGVLMHWSRIVDLPLVLSIVAFKPLLGLQGAETATLIVWPLLLLAAALALVVAIARELSGGKISTSIAAIVLVLLAKPTLLHFRPGAIDHHNLQMVLLLALILSALQIERSVTRGVLAGMAAALSLAVGIEMLPAIAVSCLAIVGLFVWRGASVARHVAAFGISLTASSITLALALLPTSAMLSPVCDAFGEPILLLTVGGGVGLLAMVAIDRFFPKRIVRLASAAGAGVIIVAGFGLKFGHCLASPYAALDPLVASMWLDKVQETVSLARMFRLAPEEIPGFHGLPLLASGMAIAALVTCDPKDRYQWALAGLALSTAFAVGVWQLRGTPAANLVAAPVFVAAVSVIWPTFATPRNLAALAFAVSPMAFAVSGAMAKPLTDTLLKPEQSFVDPPRCTRLSDVAAMKDLPRGRVVAPIDTGPPILALTHHDVIAAPFHRNNDGIRTLLQIMLAPPPVAHRMLLERRIDYVVTCRASPDRQFSEQSPEGLEAVLAKGDTPDFLMPIALGPQARIAVWRVRK